MTRPLVIIGGGEHARVVGEAAMSDAAGWTVTSVVDPGGAIAADQLGVPRIADEAAFVAELAALAPTAMPMVILGVGPVEVRRSLAERYDRSGAMWATIVHPTAWVAPSARLGRGVVVLASAVVNSGAVIGDHAIVNTGAIVEHDAQIGAFANIGPGVVVGGGATLGHGAQVGLGARIRDHVVIGHDAMIGMGAVVIASVDDDVTVVGIPARPSRVESQ